MSTALQEDDTFTAEPREKKKGMGCFFWGCLITFLLIVLLVVGLGLGAYFGLKGVINQYTSDTPADLPVVELPEEEMAALAARFESYKEAIDENSSLDPIELTARELNALIGQNKDFKGHVHVTIEEGLVGGEVSMPTDMFPGGGGRFFNATAEFDVGMVGDRLVVTVADATVNDAPLPGPFLEGLKGENLAKDAYNDPDTAKVLNKFATIEVVGDKLILTPKEPEAAPDAPSEPAEEAVEEQALEPAGAE
ncbi:hypothetical protein MalM25_01020 [Planctomycetes bacterium MalM25]|nr:hypothetical protein MalM25_01020 [Planctomycetes bacterium MalM25]